MTDLHKGREETRAALRNKAGADVEVAEKEQGHRRQQEPGLDEDDLDRDHRGEAPEELCSSGATDPSHGRSAETIRPQDELQGDDLAEVEHDERGRGDRAGDDDLADASDELIEHRHDHELEGHRRDSSADGLGGRIAQDADERLPRHEVVHEPGRSRDERERSWREEHDTGEDRDLGSGELHVWRDADRTER